MIRHEIGLAAGDIVGAVRAGDGGWNVPAKLADQQCSRPALGWSSLPVYDGRIRPAATPRGTARLALSPGVVSASRGLERAADGL